MHYPKRRIALAIAMLGYVACPVIAHADEDPTALERVTVVGSNIKRLSQEGPTAVEIIKRDEIEKSGASTVIELMSKIPSVGVALDGNYNNSFAIGASAISMRGMGEKYTLVLLNGRRLANYGFANGAENTFVDLNNIPLDALEEVQILRDGASAIYGADAVAGVVNFITKRNYQGIEVRTHAGIKEAGDNGVANLGLTLGLGDLEKEGQNLLLTLSLFHREPTLSTKHRGVDSNDYRAWGGLDNRFQIIPGTIADYTTGSSAVPLPGCQTSTGVNDNGDTVCITDHGYYMSPRQDRAGLLAVYTKRLNQNDEFFTEVGFNNNRTSYYQNNPFLPSGSVFNTAGSTNPGILNLSNSLTDFQVGDKVLIRRAITENGPSMDTVNSQTARLATGWRGMLGPWDSEASVNLNRNEVTEQISNAMVLSDLLASVQAGVLGQAGGYDPFNPNNPSSVTSAFMTTTRRQAVSSLNAFEWKMSNPEWFQLPAGPVGFAWGYQLSRESMEDNPDSRIIAQQIANWGGVASKGARVSNSLYGEFNVPVIKNMEVQAAVRGDHFSDFGNTVNPKLAVKYQPFQQILFRGSASTSFKTPTLPEMYSSSQGYYTVADWASCGKLGYVGAQCSYTPKLFVRGNPDLKPEKSKNYSLGLAVQPVKNMSSSLDWYMIDQKDTILLLDPQYILDNEFNGYESQIGRDPISALRRSVGLTIGRINSISSEYMNVGKTQTQGLDFDFTYLIPLGDYGKLKFQESNNHTLSFKQSQLPGSAPIEQVDTLNHPRWSNVASLSYMYKQYEYMLTARTYDSTKNIDDVNHTQDAVDHSRVSGYTAWDLNVNWRPSKKLSLNFGVDNMFDKHPIFITWSNAFMGTGYGNLGDLTGRFYYLNVDYKI